jgi:multidrug efflux pump subunit AcrA (membrane-fusion protein)
MIEQKPEAASVRQPEQPKKRLKRTFWLALAGLAAVLLIFLGGYVPRHLRDKRVQEASNRRAQEPPQVSFVKVRRAPALAELRFPGNLIPLAEAYIYGRATGYVRKRHVDIGDHVRRGQVLAEIDSPDLDAEVGQGRAAVAQSQRTLSQTQAALNQGRAQRDLAKVTWQRTDVLVTKGVLARQEGDVQNSNYLASEATVSALEANVHAAEEAIRGNEANLQRLIALQEFELVRAPFDGVVTARNIDLGAFISGSGAAPSASTSPAGGSQVAAAIGNAGTADASLGVASSGAGVPTGAAASGTGTEMFRIAQSRRLRVLVSVPEEDARSVRVGGSAEVQPAAFPGQSFWGKVTRTSGALDLNSRTLLTEVQIENPTAALLPGMFSQVRILSDRPNAPILIPGESLMTRSEGTEVAVLEPVSGQADDLRRVHLQPVTVGRDYGVQTEITTGLADAQEVVTTPSDVVQEGARVKAVPAPPMQTQPQAGPPQQGNRGGITPTPGRSGPAAAPGGGQGGAGKPPAR